MIVTLNTSHQPAGTSKRPAPCLPVGDLIAALPLAKVLLGVTEEIRIECK